MYDFRNPYSCQSVSPNVNMNMQNPVQDNVIVPIPSENDARSYLVAPGHSVIFKDENKPMVFYTKTVISQFEPAIFKIYDMVERKQEMPVNAPENVKPMDLSAFVTKDEFGVLQKELQALKQALGEGDKV